MYRATNGVLRVLLAIGRIPVRIEGAEHLPDEPGVILASNHLSIADPAILSMVVGRMARRRIRYMAKAEAMRVPLFGTFLRAYGGFAVRRGTPDREAYRMARAVLEEGDWLGVAPEGHRSRSGHLEEPKAGTSLLAMRSGALVLPVAIWGTERLWPVGGRLPRLGTRITVRFGEAYRPAGGDGPTSEPEPPRADGDAEAAGERSGTEPGDPAPRSERATRRRRAMDDATEDLMRRIAVLMPPEYRGRFG